MKLLIFIFTLGIPLAHATLDDYRGVPFDSVESHREYRRDQETMAKALRDEESAYFNAKPKKRSYPTKGITTEIELNYSLYTYHFTNPEGVGRKFENKVSEDGRLINNPVFGLSIRENVSDDAYRTNYFFGGVDSIGSPIYGYMRTTGFITPWKMYLGFAYGAYYMDSTNWLKKGIQHTNQIELSKKSGIVPLIGIEISQKIPLGGGLFLKINNLFTPVLSNHNVGLGYEF